ncbi:hypothetical protein Y032_0014g2203 [Ancylostoma ceylanicum]|uniref:Uncharacterized protein n=1 Tax=Ancylostoma ceylanicum TaxID=53326 RepID=A0A016V8X3_9BILA|nr:hypothetical protein Y032_0014g2203 [Ancylostoma ceylanicum]
MLFFHLPKEAFSSTHVQVVYSNTQEFHCLLHVEVCPLVASLRGLIAADGKQIERIHCDFFIRHHSVLLNSDPKRGYRVTI